MIHIDVSQTQLLPSGLRFSPDAGVLLAPPSRLKLDPTQPRTIIVEADLQELRADIDAWREDKHGLLKSGIMEPFKCRWEPGATNAEGNVKTNAKLLIWDGGRRFRVTKDDYDWLPIILDDLTSKQARSAALRTSIHNRAHLPIEQAHAFEDEMREEGLSLRAMAKKYSVDKSYIENRLNLLKCPPDVQQFAADNPGLMSHALALRPVTDKALRSELMEYAKHGVSVREIQGEIQKASARQELEDETSRAPDAETQQRQIRAADEGSAPMSRGRHLTRTTRQEATQSARLAAESAAQNLKTIEQNVEAGGAVPRSQLLVLQHKIQELLHSGSE